METFRANFETKWPKVLTLKAKSVEILATSAFSVQCWQELLFDANEGFDELKQSLVLWQIDLIDVEPFYNKLQTNDSISTDITTQSLWSNSSDGIVCFRIYTNSSYLGTCCCCIAVGKNVVELLLLLLNFYCCRYHRRCSHQCYNFMILLLSRWDWVKPVPGKEKPSYGFFSFGWKKWARVSRFTNFIFGKKDWVCSKKMVGGDLILWRTLPNKIKVERFILKNADKIIDPLLGIFRSNTLNWAYSCRQSGPVRRAQSP